MRLPARSHRRFDIPFEGAKGAVVAGIVVIAGISFGYLIFLASATWRDYLDLFVRLWIYYLAIASLFKIPVRENLIRKLYLALESKGMSAH